MRLAERYTGHMTRRPTLEQLIVFLLGLLAMLFVLLVGLLWREYRTVAPVPPRPKVEWVGERGHDLLSEPTDVLRPWMTFEYVARIFALPPQFLRDSLGITDTRYPKLSIAAYARRTGMTPDAAIARIAAVIAAYGTHE